MKINRIVAIVAIAALSFPQTANAEGPCLTTNEIESVAAFALPGILDGMVKTCQPLLEGDSFIAREGAGMVARYRNAQDETWPIAKAAFLKFAKTGSKADKALTQKSDEEIRATMSDVLGEIIGDITKPASCPQIDSLLEAFEPLPARNMAMAIGNIFAISVNSKKSFPICHA